MEFPQTEEDLHSVITEFADAAIMQVGRISYSAVADMIDLFCDFAE